MSIKVDGIESKDELQQAQAAAQAQGSSITNYSEWEQILKEFEENGIESTGSFAGDKARMQEIEEAVKAYLEEMQQQNQVEQTKPQNNENQKVKETSETDREQQLKSTVANATSSQIMADYMKYYHMLM